MDSRKKSVLISEFKKLYPNPKSELNFSNTYELLVAVMLSAQSTDKKVNEITPTLFRRYKNFLALSQAKVSEVEALIRQVNYYKTKAKHLVAMAKLVEHTHEGKAPETHEALIELPGVGNKTANVVLSELGLAHTFPVDTHVFRVSHRLGLSSGKNVKITEQELMAAFPKTQWRNLHHCLIYHGRRVCIARNPKCVECALSNVCPRNSVVEL